MNTADITALIGTLSPIILAWMGFFFKSKFKKQDKSTSEMKTAISQRLTKLENTVFDISKVINEFLEDNDFRIEFRNTLRIKTNQIIQLTDNILPEGAINLLQYWSEIIERFGLDFYYSKKRKEREKEREEYLSTLLNVRINNFYKKIDDNYSVKKKYNGEPILFSRFLELLIIHKKTEILKEKLIKNGLSRKEVINIFSDYIEDFLNELIKCVQIWERL